jgi:glyoxylase-like metal-dependent hydrolase (beta-lactamase superfamily II)
LHTHAHFDHFLASGHIKKATGAPLCLHPHDRDLWSMLEIQCQMFGVPYAPAPPPDQWIADDEELSVGPYSAAVIHTPGHTPGSVGFYFEDQKLLFSGDTLFRGGIGRTDLWGGDSRAIIQSIRERLYSLNEDTLVIPRHGGETSIGWEREHNMFVNAL